MVQVELKKKKCVCNKKGRNLLAVSSFSHDTGDEGPSEKLENNEGTEREDQ